MKQLFQLVKQLVITMSFEAIGSLLQGTYFQPYIYSFRVSRMHSNR